MTIDELAHKIEQQSRMIEQQSSRIEQQSSRIEQQSERIEQQSDRMDQRFHKMEQRFHRMDEQFQSLKETMEDGFKDSKIRDEELRGLMTFGLEAREILRDEMHRRFDVSDRKHDEQMTLLKDAVRHINSHK